MGKTVGIGMQDFEMLIKEDCFYIDKTAFIKEWWESGDSVTLIARPRRFGKTLNMSMLNRFFSNEYEGKGEIFEGLSIWKEEKYRELQGSYPVINLSFANVKEKTYTDTRERIYQLCDYLNRYYGKKVIILLDEYDTPMQEAYVNGFWDELVAYATFLRKGIAMSSVFLLSYEKA